MTFKRSARTFLALCLCLALFLLSGCSVSYAEPIVFEEADFALTDTMTEYEAQKQIIDRFTQVFMDSDYGGMWTGDSGELCFGLVKTAPQYENTVSFLTLASDALEKAGFQAIKTYEFDFTEQELLDQMDRIYEIMNDNQIPYQSIVLDTQNNRICIANDDVSFFYQMRLFFCIDLKYVTFIQAEGSFFAA